MYLCHKCSAFSPQLYVKLLLLLPAAAAAALADEGPFTTSSPPAHDSVLEVRGLAARCLRLATIAHGPSTRSGCDMLW
jgi:hypothetical protein